MPDENMACCAPSSIGRSIQEGINSARGAKVTASEIDRAIQGLEELYQRLSSQYHLQEKVISELIGARIEEEGSMVQPDVPSNGKIDLLHRQIYKCLGMMNKVESSFRRTETL